MATSDAHGDLASVVARGPALGHLGEQSLDYERSREGIDDLKYLCRLEKLVDEAKRRGRARAEAREAEALLGRIAESIRDDWTAYGRGGARFPPDGFAVMSAEKVATMGSFDAIRRALADRIVELQNALR